MQLGCCPRAYLEDQDDQDDQIRRFSAKPYVEENLMECEASLSCAGSTLQVLKPQLPNIQSAPKMP